MTLGGGFMVWGLGMIVMSEECSGNSRTGAVLCVLGLAQGALALLLLIARAIAVEALGPEDRTQRMR